MLIETSTHGRVFRIALNRPDKRNAMNGELCRDISRAFDIASNDTGIGAVLLTGNGPAFCAGMDLHETDSLQLTQLHERLFTTINRMRKPVIAAVNGAALGGGTGLVANAHIVIAGPEASFGLTEIRIGLWPVVIFRAVELAIGERRATELSLTGRIFSSQEALTYGLVTEVASEPELRALEIAATSSEFSPVALAAGLDYVHQIRVRDWDEAGRIGHRMRDRLLHSPDFKEGVKAFFEKRPPQWPSLSRH